MARIAPYDDSADALFRPAHGKSASDFFQDWDAGDIADPHLLAAELSRVVYAREEVARAAVAQIGFQLPPQGWLGGERLVQRFANWGADGFVARDDGGRTVVAFRGTESDKPEDLFADLLTLQRPWEKGGRVHAGFAEAFARTRAPLRKVLGDARSLLITGHSLGAALATLVAADLADHRPTLITFGSPRVGDGDFARLLDGVAVARFVNCCDLVTRIPPPRFDGPHVGELVSELTGATLVSTVLAGLPSVGPGPSFVDIGRTRYVSAAGRVVEATAESIGRDRQTARESYREDHDVALPSRGAVVSAGRRLVEAVTGAANARGAITSAARDLLPATAGRVPLRDLADHAPINYVSAMARSFRGAGGA